MKFEYNGYVLNLEITNGGRYLDVNCNEINFSTRYVWGMTNYSEPIERFKSEVAKYIAQKVR